MQANDHVTDLIPAYALDCLDEDEASLVAVHLGVCSVCQSELESYQVVADQLVLAAPDADPPPALKQRLVHSITPARQSQVTQPATSWWRRLPESLQPVQFAWTPISLVLIAILVISNLLLWQQVQRTGTPVPSSTYQTISLVGTNAAPAASGVIVVSLDGRQGVLVVDGLPPLEPDRQYQLWLIEDGRRDSGGVFSTAEGGVATLPIAVERPLLDYMAFGITIEPAGGSPGPTGEKVLGSEL